MRKTDITFCLHLEVPDEAGHRDFSILLEKLRKAIRDEGTAIPGGEVVFEGGIKLTHLESLLVRGEK